MNTPAPTPIRVRRVVTVQSDRRERLCRAHWYQAIGVNGEAIGYPQPTARLARASLTPAERARAVSVP